METIPITLTLFNRPFKLKINPNSEEKLRESVKKMNENIAKYKVAYSGREDFEYLAMAVMTFISELADNTNDDNKTQQSDILESLQKIEDLLNN
jgi:Cell division protein ZapA